MVHRPDQGGNAIASMEWRRIHGASVLTLRTQCKKVKHARIFLQHGVFARARESCWARYMYSVTADLRDHVTAKMKKPKKTPVEAPVCHPTWQSRHPAKSYTEQNPLLNGKIYGDFLRH